MGTGCPGIGIAMTIPSASWLKVVVRMKLIRIYLSIYVSILTRAREIRQSTTAGNILLRLLTAAVALNSPPLRQSSNVYRDCLNGLDMATLPLSSSVIFRTPHAWKQNVSFTSSRDHRSHMSLITLQHSPWAYEPPGIQAYQLLAEGIWDQTRCPSSEKAKHATSLVSNLNLQQISPTCEIYLEKLRKTCNSATMGEWEFQKIVILRTGKIDNT